MTKMVKIKKIKIKENPVSVEIEYAEKNRMLRWDDKKLKSGDDPVPEFLSAMRSMVPHMIENCELPEELESGSTVTSLSITWHDFSKVETIDQLETSKNDIGVVITGQRSMINANSPLNLNSPHKMAINEVNPDDQLSFECVEDLKRVISCAEDYLQGKRAQSDLFESVGEATSHEKVTDGPVVASSRSVYEIAETIQKEILSESLSVSSARDLLKNAEDIRELCKKEGVIITVSETGRVSCKKRGTRASSGKHQDVAA